MNTYCRALLKQIVQENEIRSQEIVSQQAKEEDFEACKAINDKWNAEIAKIRETRLAEKRKERREHILQRLLQEEQKKEEQKKALNEWVKRVKEESVTFITPENVDAAIEECLANVVNHNRALDSEGNWHEGKYPPVSPVEETQKSAAVKQ